MPKGKQQPAPLAPEKGWFLSIAVPERNFDKHLERAAQLLKQAGYTAGVASPEAITEFGEYVALKKAEEARQADNDDDGKVAIER